MLSGAVNRPEAQAPDRTRRRPVMEATEVVMFRTQTTEGADLLGGSGHFFSRPAKSVSLIGPIASTGSHHVQDRRLDWLADLDNRLRPTESCSVCNSQALGEVSYGRLPLSVRGGSDSWGRRGLRSDAMGPRSRSRCRARSRFLHLQRPGAASQATWIPSKGRRGEAAPIRRSRSDARHTEQPREA